MHYNEIQLETKRVGDIEGKSMFHLISATTVGAKRKSPDYWMMFIIMALRIIVSSR